METQENRERKDFKELSTKELNKIYFRSESIKSIAAIIVIAIVGLAIQAGIINNFGGKDVVIKSLKNPKNISLNLLNILTFIGFVTRTKWGRIVGFIACTIWVTMPIFLLKFSISILVGIWGLYVLIPSGNLFGPDRLLAKDLKLEFKWRKKYKIV
ncbi:MAG: hypothetical protein HZC48_07190 [Nitrospirae bacterium]|nr:hypothetical protein [Nitrospirota bacterium]